MSVYNSGYFFDTLPSYKIITTYNHAKSEYLTIVEGLNSERIIHHRNFEIARNLHHRMVSEYRKNSDGIEIKMNVFDSK